LRSKILKNDLTTIIHQSVVSSAVDLNHRNKQITFMSDLQEKINKLDTRPSNDLKNSLSEENSRKVNDDV
jgi:tetrahydromethanopterin S-methyltransferase subunit B